MAAMAPASTCGAARTTVSQSAVTRLVWVARRGAASGPSKWRNAALTASPSVEGTPLHISNLRLKWSVTVSGQQYLRSPVLNCPLKSAGHTWLCRWPPETA